MDEYHEFQTLHLPHLVNYVVPVAQLKDGKVEIGSGVLVRAAGKHLIATAKHCIDGKKVRVMRSIDPIRLQRSGLGGTRELHILQTGWHDSLDLGYLEIADPECAELDWDHLSTDRIVNGMVHVIGYPEVLTIPVESVPGKLIDISLCAGTFSTTVIDQSDDRMRFDYPKIGSKYDEATGTWYDSPFPNTPRGFSGGAIFAVEKTPGLVTRVQFKLLGIQYAWNEKDCVFAVPIKRWKDLVVERILSPS